MIIRTGRDGKSCAVAGALKPTTTAQAASNATARTLDPTLPSSEFDFLFLDFLPSRPLSA
jgi:hypothetical protein